MKNESVSPDLLVPRVHAPAGLVSWVEAYRFFERGGTLCDPPVACVDGAGGRAQFIGEQDCEVVAWQDRRDISRGESLDDRGAGNVYLIQVVDELA